MASDDNVNRDSCIYDPNFAIVCSFFEKFSSLCGIKHPAFSDLQQMLDSTDEVCPELIDLHVRLMRKAKKNVNPDRWQRTLAKFCYYYSPQDSWDLEQHGYENLDYKQRLRILLCACEAQFDQNIKFKNDINKLPIDELRLSPIGKDKDGIKYWIHTDEKLDLKIYKENPEEETFDLIATNRDGLIELMEKLKTECDPDRKFEEPIEEEEEDDDDDDEGEEEEEEEESEKEMGEQIENQPDIKDEQNADETRSPEQTQSDPSNEVSKKESHPQEAISNQPLSQAQSTDKVSPAKQAETPNVVTPDASKAIKKHVDVKTKRFDKSPEIVLKKEKVVDKTPKVIKAEEFAQHIEKLKSEKMLLPLLNSPLPFKEPLKGNGNETLKTKINMKFNMIKPVLQNEVLMSRIEEVKNKDLYKKVVVKRDDNPVNNYVMQINKNKEAAGKVGKPGLKLEQILKSKLAQKLAAHEPAESKVDPKQSDQSVKTDIPEKTESAINEGESSQPNPSTVPEGDTTKRKHSAEQDVETKKLKLYETVSTQPTPIDQAPPLDDADREIEEPLMLVTGVGSGKQCEAYPDYDSDSDDEREFTLFVTGVGNGNECDTGNNDAEETDKEKHAAFTHKVEDILSKNETDSEPASASTSDDLAKKPEEGEKKKPKLWTIDAICNSDSKESSKKDDISCFPNYSFNKDKKPETAYREYSFFGMAGESKENDVVPTNFYFGCDTQNPPFITDTRNVNSFKEKKTHNVKDIVQLDGDKEKNDVDYSASFTNSKPEEAFNLCMRQSTSSPTKQNSSEAINYSKPSADNVYSSVISLSASSEPEVTQNQNHSKPDVPVSNSFSSLVPYDDDDDEDDDEQTNDSLIEPDKNANDQIIESDNQTKIISSENSSNTVDSNFENKISENVAEPANKEEIAEDLSQSDHKDEAPQHLERNDENDETANHLSPNDQNEKVTEHLPESDEASEKLSQNDRNDEVPENLLQNDRNDEAPEDPVANDGSDEMAEDLSQNDLDQKPPEVNVEITDSVPQQASNIVEQSLSENKEEPKAVNEVTVVQPVEPEVPKDDLVDSKIQSEIPVVEKTDELNAPEDLQTPTDPIEEKNAAETDVKEQTFASEPQCSLESVENAEPEVAKTDPFIEQQLDSESLPSEEPLKPENADAPLSPKLIDDQSLPDVNTEAESNDMVESMAEDLTTSLPQPATESVESPPTEVEKPDPVVCESVVEKPVEVIPQSLPTDQQCTKETEISEPQNDVDIQQPQVEPQTDEPEIEKPLDSEQATDLSTSKTEETDWPEPPVAESNIAQIAPPTDAIKIDIAEPEPTQSKPESDQKESSIVEQTVSPEVKSTDTDLQVPSEEIEQSKSPVQQPPPVDETSQQTDEQKPPPENVFSDDDAGPPDAPKSPDRSSEDDADKTEPLDKPDQSAQTLEPSDNKSKTSETAEQSGPALTLRSSGRVTRSVKKDDPSPKKAAKKQPKEKKSKKLQPQEESEPAEPVKPVKKTRGRKKKAPKTPVKSTTPKTQSDDSSDDESNDEADNENKRAKGSIKLNIKKVEKKSEDEEPERDAEAETETDKKPEKPAKTATTKKKTSKKGWLNEIDVSNIEPPTATPIRQSRRIAQLKIKEQAEGKYIEQITPAKKSAKADSKSKQVSAKKNNKTPTKKSSKTKIAKEESDGEDSNYEKSSSKKKRKKKDQKKKFKMGDPWKAGSDSSTEEDAEEEDHFEDEEEDEDIAIDDASDHEFSPESDLEDEDFEPVKRARTAHSKPKTEDKAERDDLCCQKCRTAEQPEWILLCDKCDDGWHAACLRPPLMTIPEGDWYCPPCQHNMLISSLHKFLKSYDKDVKKRDNEVLRKKRLEYVGISFSNIISEQQKSEKTDAKVKKEDEEFVKYDISEDDNTEEESEEEPLYTLRVRRQANVSYRLNEYDELMNSAIQTEANGEPVEEGEQNVTATESLAKSDETSVPEKPTEPEESTEQPSEEKDDKDESSEDDDEEEEDESPVKSKEEKVSPMILQLKGIRKKAARLTKLDVSSDDDHYSDEDFKGSSGEDYDEDEYAKSESDSDNARYRKSNRGPVRRSTRARVTRYDNDFINDDDSEEEDYEPKKKKKRSRNSDSDSEEEDSTWGKRKRSKYSRAHRSSSSKKKRKRIVFDGDSDEEKKERKEKKGKKSRVTYGLEESEDDHPQRRTRGKKINYLENLGSDSDDDNTKSASKSRKVVSDDDDYVNEDEEQETGAENAINENGDQSESSVGAISKKSRRKENDVSEKSSELGKSASSLHELIAANNTSVIRTYSKGSNAENVRIQKCASASEPAVPEMDVESKPNDVSAPDKGKKGKKSPKKDVQMYSGVAKGDNKLILKKVDPTNPSLEGMQSMAQSIPQMISSPSSYSMARKMMPPMAGDGQFGPNMGGPAAAGNPPSYSEVGIVYEEADGHMGPDGDKYAHPLRVVSPNKLYGQDGQPIPPIPPMMGRPAPPYMMGPGMPARPMMPGMPPNMMARGVMPMPPGMHLRGPPPGAMPPNAMPPGAMPPNAMPPGAMPPNAMPPGAMPPNAMPSGVMPPNALPPNAMPPGGMPPNVMQAGAMPPNLMPPNTMAPNIMPPMSQAPIMAANVAVPSGPNPIAEPSGESPKRRARGRGKKQLEIERLKRESMNANVQGDEMMPLHMLKPHPSDMNAVRPPPTSSFNSPSPPTPFANYPNMPRLPYSTAGPPASTTQPPSTQSAVTVTVGNPSKRVKITPTRMRQPSPAQNVMRFPRPPSSMMHGAGHLPLDPSPSGGSAVPVNNGDNSMPPRSQPSPNGTPPRTESNVKKEPPMEQYYQPTSYAQASQVPRAFNPRPEFAFAQKPLPPAMYPHPIPSTAAPPTVINRPTTVTTSTVITGPISSQGPLPAGVGKPDVPGTPYPAPYPMNAPPSTISSPTSKSNLTPSSTAAVTTPTSAYQALHIKQLPTAQSAAPAVPYGGPYIVPNSYPPQSHTTPPFSRVPSSAQPSFAKSPQPLSTASPTIPYAASTDTTSNTSSAEYAPPATVGAAPTSDAGFQFQECDTAVASGNEADSGTQFQAGYDEENAASEDQPSGEFGGLVSYFSSQREDDLDA